MASAVTIAPGSTLSYTLNVSNNGPNAIATTVTVTDMLPAGYVLNRQQAQVGLVPALPPSSARAPV